MWRRKGRACAIGVRLVVPAGTLEGMRDKCISVGGKGPAHVVVVEANERVWVEPDSCRTIVMHLLHRMYETSAACAACHAQ